MEPDDFNTRELAPGALLWHYTNFKGLEGILAGAIWASSVSYLNDTEEFHQGVKIALGVLQLELAAAINDIDRPAVGAILGEVTSFLRERYKPHDIFVAALSAKEDDLSQWRAYGGSSGPMFSIGFDPKALEQQGDKWLFELARVKYEKRDFDPDLRLALRLPIDEIVDALRESTHSPQQVSQWAASLVRELMMLAPLYKHPKFAAEEEWRLIRRQAIITRRPALELKFRQAGSLVVPYLAMPLHTPASQEDVWEKGARIESPIAAITIGPSPYPKELHHAVSEMTARIGLALVRIESSSVPFRNW